MKIEINEVDVRTGGLSPRVIKEEGNETVTNCHQLKLRTHRGTVSKGGDKLSPPFYSDSRR